MNARQTLAAAIGHKLFLQDATQHVDILDAAHGISDEMVAMLSYLVFTKGYSLELTALRRDHHDDSALGHGPPWNGVHAFGNGADCWPLNLPKAGDYMQQDTHPFRQFLVDITHGPYYMQTGLGGAADTPGDAKAAGAEEFDDNGSDHVHIGVKKAA